MKLRYWIVLIGCIALDLGTKWFAGAQFDVGQEVFVIPHVFYFTYVFNTGGAWSLFSGGNSWIFIIIALAASAVVIYVLLKKLRPEQWLERLALVLILAGTLGNAIDRIMLGHVRDFIGVYIGSYPFPVFNVADMCLVIGIGLFILETLLEKDHDKNKG